MPKQSKYHVGIEIDKLTNNSTIGHIKEPEGVDFYVDSTPLTQEDKKQISDVIAHYKRTGRKMPSSKNASPKRVPLKKKTHII